MNKLIILSIAFFTFAEGSFASDKICFYAGGDYNLGSKGDLCTARITKDKLTIKNLKGESAWEGTFSLLNDSMVKGKDSKIYLNFYAKGDDGCNIILVDKELLKSKSKGFIKFRCRGEGYSETKFLCRDSN